MSLSRIAIALVGGTALLAAAGCASDNNKSYGNRPNSNQMNSSARVQTGPREPVYFRTRETADFGSVYTTLDGRALYIFRGDRMNQSRCYGTCARNWPPYRASADARPHGQWSIVTRRDGSRQWAYGGRPAYMWSGDREPGQITGDGRGGTWSVMRVPQR